jgi:hypothetical protein
MEPPFLPVGPPRGDQPRCLAAVGVDDDQHGVSDPADADPPCLAIVVARVQEAQDRPVEDVPRNLELDAMLIDVPAALGIVPLEHRAM